MYGRPPRLSSDPICTVPLRNAEDARLWELLGAEKDHLERTLGTPRVRNTKTYAVGEKLLVARGPTLSSFKKTSSLETIFYVPCTVVWSNTLPMV